MRAFRQATGRLPHWYAVKLCFSRLLLAAVGFCCCGVGAKGVWKTVDSWLFHGHGFRENVYGVVSVWLKKFGKLLDKCRCSQFANNLNMNRSKIHEKSYKIAPKSTPSRSQIDENVPLGRFGSQVAPMSAAGRSE